MICSRFPLRFHRPATVLYFCVFAVVFYQSEQTAALLGSGTTVVLDAGHGGEDGGATGVSGTSEAALNLEISLRVRDLLRLCGVQVSAIVRQPSE